MLEAAPITVWHYVLCVAHAHDTGLSPMGVYTLGLSPSHAVCSLDVDAEAPREGLGRLQDVDALHVVPRVSLRRHRLHRHRLLVERMLGTGVDLHEAEARV